MQHNPDADEFERQNIKKYQGDLLYQRCKYKEALCMYQDSWQCLSPNNAVLGRELTESMALCLLKLGKVEDALAIAKKIQDDNQNDSTVWYLLSQIYKAMGNTEEEISFLQRCTSLHPWNYQYWYLLALAYEKTSLSLLGECSNSDLRKVHSGTCVCYQDGKEKDFPNKSSKGGLLAKEECSEQYYSEHVEVTKESLENVNVAGKVETGSEVLELSKTFYCENCTSADYRKNKTNSGLFLSDRKQLHLTDTFCDCLSTLKPGTEHKMKWRKHILSFGCLVKSRFFLEKPLEVSCTFVTIKRKEFLKEVQEKIAKHAECGCANLIDKVLEMLHTSVIHASEQTSPKEENQTITEASTQLKNTTSTIEFEEKWFGDLLSYMSQGS
ncbi:uncharacterized protein LOC141887114 isoform X2 [Acropora palmata]